MSIRGLAKEHKCTPQRVYTILYELEAKGLIKPTRKPNLKLSLSSDDVQEIRRELFRRGYDGH